MAIMTDKQFYIAGTVLLGGVILLGYATKKATEKTLEAVNPVSHDNIFNRGVNAVTQSLTGDPNATLGTKIYEWLNPEEGVAETYKTPDGDQFTKG